jgi:hypothetical protein
MSDEILARFKEEFNRDPEYHKAMYDKYLPVFRKEAIDIDRLFSIHDEAYIQEVTYFLMYSAKKLVSNYIKPKPDFTDLKNLLDLDLERLPELKDLSLTHGLSFCDAFTKEHRLACPIVGKGNSQAIKLLKDDYGLYKATLKACYFHRTKVTPKAVLRTVEMLVPVVSNFKPVVAAKIWYDYAVKQALEAGRDYVALLVSSEGWLGRLLSGYKIAYDFPQLKVYYVSVDPNPLVNREFHNMVKTLREYHDLPNWFPETHMTGSENFRELPKGTNYQYDMQFTSPPYFNTEVYMEGYIITLDDSTEIVLADNEDIEVQGENKYEPCKVISVTELELGMITSYGGTVVSIKNTGQSHNTSGTAEEWRVNFLLATYKCHKDIIKPGGYTITNIANVRSCMKLEEYTVRSGLEAGFEYLGESWYKLSRKPSKNKNSEITSRAGEPIFIFRNPVE